MNGPLARQPNRPILDVCSSCHLRSTKPGSQKPEIARYLGRAVELDELRSAGATFAYPEALESWEWTAIAALERARRRDQNKETRRRKRDAEQARVEGLVQRRG
jgi:hypothetical protein